MTRSALFVATLLAACSSSHAPAVPDPPDARGSGGGNGTPGADAGADAAPDAFVDATLQADYDDLATALGDVLRTPANLAIIDGVNQAFGAPPAGFIAIMPGMWQGWHDSVAYTYTYHCEDVNGFDNTTCGPGTDHIHWEATTQGTATVDTFAMSEVKLSSHWHIRDIAVGKPRVEDSGRFLISGKLATDQTRFQLTIDTAWTGVRYAAQPTLPFGGSIALSITAHRSRPSAVPTDRDFTAAATITFAQDTSATIVIDSSQSYSLDMTTGAVVHL